MQIVGFPTRRIKSYIPKPGFKYYFHLENNELRYCYALQKLKVDTQVDHWKNVKSTSVTYDTWLPTATQNPIKNTCLKNCNRVSLSCKRSCNRTPRTKHKTRITDVALVTLLVLHTAQRTVHLVGDRGGTVTDQTVPGRCIDRGTNRVSFKCFILKFWVKKWLD